MTDPPLDGARRAPDAGPRRADPLRGDAALLAKIANLEAENAALRTAIKHANPFAGIATHLERDSYRDALAALAAQTQTLRVALSDIAHKAALALERSR